MGRRLRSEVEWRPEKPRSRVSLVVVALGVAVALVIGIGLHNARTLEPSRASIAPVPDQTDEDAGAAYARRPSRQREARLPSFSTEPRTSPSPRRAAAPRRAPQPRGELTEAETSVDR